MRHGIDSLQKGFQANRAGIAKSLFQDESAVTAIEYALLASLIAMVVLLGIVSVGDEVWRLWNWVAVAVTGAM